MMAMSPMLLLRLLVAVHATSGTAAPGRPASAEDLMPQQRTFMRCLISVHRTPRGTGILVLVLQTTALNTVMTAIITILTMWTLARAGRAGDPPQFLRSAPTIKAAGSRRMTTNLILGARMIPRVISLCQSRKVLPQLAMAEAAGAPPGPPPALPVTHQQHTHMPPQRPGPLRHPVRWLASAVRRVQRLLGSLASQSLCCVQRLRAVCPDAYSAMRRQLQTCASRSLHASIASVSELLFVVDARNCQQLGIVLDRRH